MLHKKLYCDGLKWRLEETQLKIRPCHCPAEQAAAQPRKDFKFD